MKWVRYLFSFSSLLMVARAAATTQGPSTESTRNLIRFVYGDQWKFAQYCNDTRDPEKITRDDTDIELFHNGSFFKSGWLSGNILNEAQVIGARSRNQLSVLCSINSWGYANKLVEEQSNLPHENESKCSNEMEKFSLFLTHFASWNRTLSHVRLDYNYWRQFNSFGRLESGPTYNNDLLVGDYDACEQLREARYCLGSYGNSIDGLQNQDQIPPFKIGLCLPRVCSPRILRNSPHLMQTVNSIVKENLLTSLIDPSYGLRDVHCPPLRDSPWLKSATRQDFVGKLLLYYVPLAWFSMLILGTLCGLTGVGASNVHRKYIEPFDVRANWSSFCNGDHLDSRLAGLNGAKVICMNWLLMSHISMSMSPYLKDIGRLRPYTWHGAVVLQGQHGVPVFFIISGLLAGLKYLKRSRISTINMLISRYLRLVPMYLLMYAYVKKFAHLTNDGPFWDYGVSVQSEARQCMNESWLVPVLLLANFTPPFAHCIITGWHIANDFQIFLILPPLFWLYRKSLWTGRASAIVAFLVTHLSHVWHWGTSNNYSYYTTSAEPALYGPRIVLDRLAIDYVNPLGRLGTYFIGVLVADLLLTTGRPFNRRQSRRVTFVEERPLTKRTEAVDEEADELNKSDNMQLNALTVGKQQQKSGTQDHRRVANNNGGGHHRPETLNGDGCKHSSLIDGQESFSSSPYGERSGKGIYANALYTFKDTAVLLFGMQAAYLSLFTVIWPTHMKLLFEPYSKPIAYPWVRLNVELGWAICLYYLLRDNGDHKGNAQERAGARTEPVEPTAAEVRAETNLAPADDRDDEHKGTELKNSHSQLAPAVSTVNGHNGDESARTSAKYNLNFGGSLLKFRFWNVLVKLNYTLMLVHFSVVRHFVQSQRQLLIFTWTNFFQLATFIILVTYAICLVIHLTIEMPLMALINLLRVKITSR